MPTTDDPRAEFIRAACVPLDTSHASGTLDRAEAILAAHPEVASSDVHTAAVLGDADAVRRFLAADPANATEKGGPHGWDALTHLCFSRYLRLDPARSDGFVRAAEALLDAGADANTGWWENDHPPAPVWESALYGAAGIAHHPGLTRLLLERNADPNDGETPYHAPEAWDDGALRVLLESGRITPENLVVMLIRKHDWHDRAGVALLLEHGADPNLQGPWGRPALHHAVARDNDAEIIALLLDHGADPMSRVDGESAFTLAARRGRGDLLELFERRGMAPDSDSAEQLIAACARDDAETVRAIVERHPDAVRAVLAEGGRLLAQFAGVGNAGGVGHLLDLGVDVDARFAEGDGYFDVAPASTALHVAAWRAQHETVRLLIGRGAPVDVQDGGGRTPLMLAVRACVDSYWTGRRAPDSVDALLRAGASVRGVPYLSGYEAADALLRRHGAES